MKGNLLIVDDETVLLTNLQLILEDYADHIFLAKNGAEAEAILKKEDIHCVVCDINMPVMNGVELIKRANEMKFDCPFIFYSGHGNDELMLEVAKYGAFDFLDKPLLDGLEEVVKAGLQLGLNPKSPAKEKLLFISDYTRLLEKLSK